MTGHQKCQSDVMDGHGRKVNEGCGLYGDGQHSWTYWQDYLRGLIKRKCCYCGLREQCKVKLKWSPEQ